MNMIPRRLNALQLLAFLVTGHLHAQDTNDAIDFNTFLLNGDQLALTWEGSAAPYQVQSATTLPAIWKNETDALNVPSAILLVPNGTTRAFYRVVSGALVMPLTAEYTLTFNAEWSEETHPDSFPGNPHFSGLVGGTHHSDYVIWTPGGMATPGVEQMAETGSKSTLESEVDAAVAAGIAKEVISGGGVGTSPGSVSVTFQASQTHPLVSVVSMIAPSPDWFVGTHGLALFENGQWKNEVVVELQPYDAGTDDGVNYNSGDDDSDPQVPITRITGAPLKNGSSVARLGTFTFSRKLN